MAGGRRAGWVSGTVMGLAVLAASAVAVDVSFGGGHGPVEVRPTITEPIPGSPVVDLDGNHVGYVLDEPPDLTSSDPPGPPEVVDMDGNVVGHMDPQFVPLGSTSSSPRPTTVDSPGR